MSKKNSQKQSILKYMQSGRGISQVTAYNQFQCWRLASRINDLRNDGHNIITTTIKRNGASYALYKIREAQ